MNESHILAALAVFATASAYPFILYPVILLFVTRLTGCRRPTGTEVFTPSVSVVVPVHNGADFIGAKLENLLGLDYPSNRLDILVASDGSTDQTNEIVNAFASSQVRLLALEDHDGKNVALNKAITACTSEIIVVTDVDALLSPNALRMLVRWFADATVGGVVGRKALHTTGSGMDSSQQAYNGYQEWIKNWESRLYSTAMNEGKLHALRRDLYTPIPVGCMDDLHNLLSVVSQGSRFYFDSSALAHISIPSSDPRNEIERRRRIVNGSLRAIFQFPDLLNPLRHPRYSFLLWSQKISRRLAPFSMVGVAVTAGVWGTVSSVGLWFFACCLVLPLLALLVHARILPGRGKGRGLMSRLFAVPYYFVLGNLGTLLGVLDLAMRRRNADRWVPRKRARSAAQA